MNIVLLSPHFPEHQYRYALALKEQGARVLGLGDEPPHYLAPHVRAALSDYFHVSDLHHYDELLRACGQITWRYGKIDRIDSLNEYWLETEAALRTDFNVVGIQNHEIRLVKEKSEMKRLFQAHGIACARGETVATRQEALHFIAQTGYPVVLKPNVGVGASQTYKIESEAQLLAHFDQRPASGWIIEEYIAGQILTFDGLADRQGQPVFFTSMVYSDGVMEIVSRDDHVYFYTLRDIPSDLETLGRQLLEIFPVRERFFHFEFFRRHDTQELVALEVNLRPSGGPSVDLYNFSHDIDLYHEWANVVLHNHFNTQVERKYFCCYAGRKHNKTYRHSHAEILWHCGDRILYHDALPGVFRPAMGDYFYVFRSPEEAEILDMAQFIQAC